MLKRLLVISSILLLLVVGFALVPAPVAHADSCNGPCGQDPVAAGCVGANGQYQYIVAASNFTYGNSTWQIRLRSSTRCSGKLWASLVLVSGSNGIPHATYIKVRSLSDQQSQFDILYSSTFYSGAYTNMINDTGGENCAFYSGAFVTPARPTTC